MAEPGDVINGRYALRTRIASGATADVYLGDDLRLGREVAVKVLSAEQARDRRGIERFRQAAQAAAALSHPNIVAVYDLGAADDTAFLVMQSVAGPDLRSVLRERGRLVEREALRVAADIAAKFPVICETLAATRPTAVNLFWAIERMKHRFAELTTHTSDLAKIRNGMVEEARQVHLEKKATDEAIGHFGAEFMPTDGQVMTQCNAGALATGGIGTALGVIRIAFQQGKKLHVLVPETRPYLQGARLTAWELHKGGIPLTLITDNMVGHFLKTGKVGAIVTGADRIAANGDTANKIGTYGLAVQAHFHGVPFYVAAPLSTVDFSLPDGSHIPIEERAAEEMTHSGETHLSPDGVPVWNPAFDVTPANLITAIITEKGIARAPFGESLRALAKG